MLELDDDELCLLGLCATEGVGPASVARLRREARSRGVPLHVVMAMSAAELEAEVGLPRASAEAVAAMADPCRTGWSVLAQLSRIGASVVIEDRPGYPARLREFLGTQAPPVLFVAGSPSVLQNPCTAIVGSRQPSRGARGAARALAGELAASGTTVVSGGARGIDTTAHRAAASAGSTIVVPALGLARFRWRGLGVAELMDRGWCAVGQFPPSARWRAAHALMRNRTIVALSDAVVAFEPRDTGGTWQGCTTALRMRKPLFVVTASREGAKGRGLTHLVRRGGVALDPARMPDSAALAQLVADYRPPVSLGQLPLLDSLEP